MKLLGSGERPIYEERISILHSLCAFCLSDSRLHSGMEVEFDRIDERDQPRQERLVGRMFHVSIE